MKTVLFVTPSGTLRVGTEQYLPSYDECSMSFIDLKLKCPDIIGFYAVKQDDFGNMDTQPIDPEPWQCLNPDFKILAGSVNVDGDTLLGYDLDMER
jgi:hypothetical protein